MVDIICSEYTFDKTKFDKFCDKFGFVFPQAFVNYLQKYNDAELAPNIIHFLGNDCCVRYFYGTTDEKFSDIGDVYMWYKDRLPHKCIPIADPDFGNQICMSVDQYTFGKIYFWDHEEMDTDVDEECCLSLDDMIFLANSFEELLDRIQKSPY